MEERDVIDQLLDLIQGRYYGKYRGEVVDNDDETHRGRLKVKVPAALGDTQVWALPCVPYAGKNVGIKALPPKGASVWVEFEAGHLSHPIWVGCFWVDNELSDDDAKPSIKLFRTDKTRIRIDDEAGTIEISVQDGAALTFSSSRRHRT
jgi:uncharacterized protein involved in type VI secretion and phage assembly